MGASVYYNCQFFKTASSLVKGAIPVRTPSSVHLDKYPPASVKTFQEVLSANVISTDRRQRQ